MTEQELSKESSKMKLMAKDANLIDMTPQVRVKSQTNQNNRVRYKVASSKANNFNHNKKTAKIML